MRYPTKEKIMLCQYCEIKEIEMKRRPLCKECYQFLHKENCLSEYPLIDVRSSFIESLTDKYGENIIDEYAKIIQSEKQGLKSIADKYGFTKEYARQVFEKLYGFHYTVIKREKIKKKEEKKLIERQLKKDPTYKVENFKDGLIKKGAIAEKKVLDICATLGYTVKPFIENNSIDLVVNDYLVEVKSAWKSMIIPGGKTPCYRFNLRDSQRKTDFIVCYAAPLNKFFIIPISDFNNGCSIWVAEKESNVWNFSKDGKHQYKSTNRFWKYLEAWHLLERKENKEIIFTNGINKGVSSL
jgi:hypothetical protein